ncbi:MAG: threo-3-hydroxy-L-aspartate ammonia-lyase [Rhodothermia bacterium]|nr:MAG: threo-3-hydroxy-L-aspartate ammonia-lyase [Rhodothermia bacterium]
MADASAGESIAQAKTIVSFDDIHLASEALFGIAHRTPVLTSSTLDRLTGGQVFLKCENFQRTGSFKFRGAYNALSKLDLDQKKRGVLTFSSGNHAQAVALSGSILGIPTTVIMPNDAPETKLEATNEYGAEVVEYDRNVITREELALRLSEERGLPIIPPYDHKDIVAGQGTAVLELISDYPDLDLVLTPCGGGGLLSGSAIAAKGLHPGCVIVGVEPATADDATRSFRTGELQTVVNPNTVADGARTPYLGKITFPLVLQYVDDMVTVSEQSILKAMFFLWTRMKLVVEPTGALALSALLSSTIEADGRRIGVVLSGGNVDVLQAAKLFEAIEG